MINKTLSKVLYLVLAIAIAVVVMAGVGSMFSDTEEVIVHMKKTENY